MTKSVKYVDRDIWSKMEPEDQIALIKQCTFEKVELEVHVIPKLNLDNIGHMFNQFKINPKLLRIALVSSPHNLSEENAKKVINAFHELKDGLSIKDFNFNNLTIVPLDSFNILDHYEILHSKIKERNGMQRCTSILTVKRLFNIHYSVNISKVIEVYDDSHQIAYQDYYRVRLNRGDNHISIGCARYSLLDLEQLAVQLGYTGQLFDVTNFPD